MSGLDWVVLIGTLGFIGIYGTWKSRGVHDMGTYFRDRSLSWPTIGLSIMATQASAITFLSTPGQAFGDGMRFAQFYFGLPLAMIIIAAVFVPIYHRLNVYTAYEYLGLRFDGRVQTLGALLFLMQRGLAAGITIYAPSIVLSTIFGWPINLTNLGIGLFVITYTVMGGTRAVSETQKLQMIVMLSGLALVAVLVVLRLPEEVSLASAVKLAGALDRMNVVSFDFNLASRYNFWSGMLGGCFLALAYFGTDQSQVQRYLSGRSVRHSQIGLLFNGIFKLPMQVAILFVGVLVFVFYLFTPPPLLFNASLLARAQNTPYAPQIQALALKHSEALEVQRAAASAYLNTLGSDRGAEQGKAALRAAAAQVRAVRAEARAVVSHALPGTDPRDTDFVFLTFVLRYVPAGLVGLLVAVILCAAMSSSASELAALGSTTTIDLYKRIWRRPASPKHDLLASKLFTVLWGAVAVGFATFATLVDNLIEAVNIVGSIFYGTALGLFVVAFFLKRVTATPVLIAALVAQATVSALFFTSDLGFLWYNIVGCSIVVFLSLVLQSCRTRAGSMSPEGSRP